MALLLAGSFTMPKTSAVRMPTYKPCNHRLAIIKCGGKHDSPDVSHGPGGGQINSTKPKRKENDSSLGLKSNSENIVKKTDGGVGGVTPKKTSSTTSASN